jgi:hypothetical protein
MFNKNKSGLRVWSNILYIIGLHLLIRVGLVVNDTTILVFGGCGGCGGCGGGGVVILGV